MVIDLDRFRFGAVTKNSATSKLVRTFGCTCVLLPVGETPRRGSGGLHRMQSRKIFTEFKNQIYKKTFSLHGFLLPSHCRKRLLSFSRAAPLLMPFSLPPRVLQTPTGHTIPALPCIFYLFPSHLLQDLPKMISS